MGLKPYPKQVIVKRVKRIKPRPMSGKKEKEIAARNLLSVQLRKERGDWCQAHLPVCSGRWTDMHELLARSQGGDPLEPANILCVCRTCHRWITDHPAEALRLGLRYTRQIQAAGLYC